MPAAAPSLDEAEASALFDRPRRSAAVQRRSRRSRRLALHLRLDRPAQGRDAEPRQYVARRGQRRALSAADAGGPGARRCCRSASIMARTSCFSTWAAGGCVVPLDYLTAARRHPRGRDASASRTLAGVPPLWVQLVEAPWPPEAALSLRRLTNSGGKLAALGGPPAARAVPGGRHLFDVRPHRGVPLDLSRAGLARRRIRIRSGSAIPFAEIMVVDADGTATPARRASWSMPARWSPRAIGRIRSAPPSASSRRPRARAYGGMAVWSGDRVRRDAEGLLYFVGREDAMIKTAGNRVSPTEVEEAAIASRPGRPRRWRSAYPDDRLGEAIALVVAAGPARRRGGLRAFLKRELPNFMQPARSSGATSCRAARTASSTAKRMQERADRMSKPMGADPRRLRGRRDGMLLIGGRRADALVARGGGHAAVRLRSRADRRARSRASAPPFPASICIMP